MSPLVYWLTEHFTLRQLKAIRVILAVLIVATTVAVGITLDSVR